MAIPGLAVPLLTASCYLSPLAMLTSTRQLISAACLTTIIASPSFAQAQKAAPAASSKSTDATAMTKWQSMQGVTFVAVPGSPVLISTLETRVSDFATFVKDSGYKWSEKPHFPQTDDHPVVQVNLQDAVAFCNWLTLKERQAGTISDLQSYRLPTNQEWDAAAGLTSIRKERQTVTQEVEDKKSFPWGVEWPPPPQAGNFNSREINDTDDGYVYTAPVGVFKANAEKIHDLGGNVWEWAWDQEIRAETFGTLRGGSWMYFRKECLLSGYQYQVPADLRAPSVGFRCVFEDKHLTAVFLAAAEEIEEKSDQEKRGMISTGPKVSAEEVEKMRASMDRKSATTQAGTEALPDIKTLAPYKAGQPFTNSLGMVLRPVAETSLLAAEHEVRVMDYQACMTAMNKVWRKPTFDIKDNHPVVNVTWQESRDFCSWLTTKERETGLLPANARYRLPTDAEWSQLVGLKSETGSNPAEKHEANKTDFPWGIEWPPPSLSANVETTQMNGYQDNYSYTSAVGSFSPNGSRLYDLSGNIAEWCEDLWPGTTSERVARGGSWLSSSKESLLSSSRLHLQEDIARLHVGFRVVLAVDAAK
jgi:formylglycine-generating enzyme required for sulfatase activity